MHLFCKILRGKADSEDPDQTAPQSDLGLLCLLIHFIGQVSVHNFRTFIIHVVTRAQLFKTNDVVSQHIVKTWIIKYGMYTYIFAEKM